MFMLLSAHINSFPVRQRDHSPQAGDAATGNLDGVPDSKRDDRQHDRELARPEFRSRPEASR
jgi:hypothetical protein